MGYFRYTIWLIVIVIGVIFTLMNARTVEIDYYFGSAKANVFLPLLIALVFIVGAVLGYLAAVPKIIKLKRTIRKLSRPAEKPMDNP